MAVPSAKPDGEFFSEQDWINHATSYIGGMNALCLDSLDRPCRQGSHFMRATKENTYPIRFWYGYGGQTKAEQAKSKKAALATMKMKYPWRYE